MEHEQIQLLINFTVQTVLEDDDLDDSGIVVEYKESSEGPFAFSFLKN